ncbi:MAG: esterase/lipase family protein [Sandaracinaceae bacterium]
MSEPQHVVLIPGMFGFARLAGYDYFQHLARALVLHFGREGYPVRVHVVAAQPTASIRRRAAHLARVIRGSTADDGGPIHLIGHSTGGLDGRLLLSPSTHLGDALPDERPAWMDRVRSLVTLNSPHHGTPLASFFATVSGTRLLYATSLLTVATLTLGRPGLTLLSQLLGAIETLDDALGFDAQILDRATSFALRFLNDEARQEVKGWLDGIRRDQGGIIQLMPEAMDVFNAATEDRETVRYGCVATAGREPGAVSWLENVRSPTSALSATIYQTLYRVTARESGQYRYPEPPSAAEGALSRTLGSPSRGSHNDGVVPTRSMLWGELLWSGRADHLDIVGHFYDDGRPRLHLDWLRSGSRFDRAGFARMVSAVGDFLLGRST